MNKEKKLKELQMVNVTEVQRLLGYSRQGVYGLIWNGRLPAQKPVGRWLIKLSDVEDFLNSNGV